MPQTLEVQASLRPPAHHCARPPLSCVVLQVGLRPGRPSVRLELEHLPLDRQLDDGRDSIPVVHNYGQGRGRGGEGLRGGLHVRCRGLGSQTRRVARSLQRPITRTGVRALGECPQARMHPSCWALYVPAALQARRRGAHAGVGLRSRRCFAGSGGAGGAAAALTTFQSLDQARRWHATPHCLPLHLPALLTPGCWVCDAAAWCVRRIVGYICEGPPDGGQEEGATGAGMANKIGVCDGSTDGGAGSGACESGKFGSAVGCMRARGLGMWGPKGGVTEGADESGTEQAIQLKGRGPAWARQGVWAESRGGRARGQGSRGICVHACQRGGRLRRASATARVVFRENAIGHLLKLPE